MTQESQDRKIVGAIVQNGRTYKAGDEDALVKVVPPNDIARLVKAGQLSGDWGTEPEVASEPKDAEAEAKEPEADEEIDSEHMEGLPVLADLSAHLATLTTVEDVKALHKTDKRKGAKPMYAARLAEIKAEG